MAKEGKRQSPINIEKDNVVEALSVTGESPLKWEYTKKHCLNVENTGSSWKVNVDGTGSSTFKQFLTQIFIYLIKISKARTEFQELEQNFKS